MKGYMLDPVWGWGHKLNMIKSVRRHELKLLATEPQLAYTKLIDLQIIYVVAHNQHQHAAQQQPPHS